MRTFLFTLFILLLIGIGVWYKFYDFKWPFGSNKPLFKESPIAPFNEWKSILQGTWDYKKEYKSPSFGCIDEGEVEYSADGTFHKYSSIKQYHTNILSSASVLNNSDQWYTGGGSVSGDWVIDTLNGSIDETINACKISRTWIKERWTENVQICNTYYIQSTSLGNFKGASEKRWVEKFNNDSIIVRGRDYSSDMDITFWFKKRQ